MNPIVIEVDCQGDQRYVQEAKVFCYHNLRDDPSRKASNQRNHDHAGWISPAIGHLQANHDFLHNTTGFSKATNHMMDSDEYAQASLAGMAVQRRRHCAVPRMAHTYLMPMDAEERCSFDTHNDVMFATGTQLRSSTVRTVRTRY